MKLIRLVTLAAAGSALVAVAAPAAQAQELSNSVTGAAKTAGMATRNALPVVQGAIGGKVGEKVQDVQKTIQGGSDAIAGVNDLVG
ncbi:hypothetical protein [Streptacidiphilus cavernicola]|uniref:ATP-binding protein n=1 Tax=Streptacidiphilus cavernicola TaxID=3342716 RepID=A0ABV6W217_9ACTN